MLRSVVVRGVVVILAIGFVLSASSGGVALEGTSDSDPNSVPPDVVSPDTGSTNSVEEPTSRGSNGGSCETERSTTWEANSSTYFLCLRPVMESEQSLSTFRSKMAVGEGRLFLGGAAGEDTVYKSDLSARTSYRPTANSSIVALNSTTHERDWTVELDGGISRVRYIDGTVFGATASGWLYAIDAERGTVTWRRNLTESVGIPKFGWKWYLVAMNGTVWAKATSSRVDLADRPSVLLDARTGEHAPDAPAAPELDPFETTVYSDSMLVFESADGLVAYDMAAQSVVWRAEDVSTPLVRLTVSGENASTKYGDARPEEFMALASSDGLHFVDSGTGRTVTILPDDPYLWLDEEGVTGDMNDGYALTYFEADRKRGSCPDSGPTGCVVSSETKVVRGYDASGGLLWERTYDIREGPEATPLAVTESTYYRQYDVDSERRWELQGLSHETHEVQWRRSLSVYSVALTLEKDIVVETADGLLRIDAESGRTKWSVSGSFEKRIGWSAPEGPWLVVTTDGRKRVVDPETGDVVAEFDAGPVVYRSGTFGIVPDTEAGHTVRTAGYDVHATGDPPTVYANSSAGEVRGTLATVAPEGSYAVSVDGELYVVSTSDSQSSATVYQVVVQRNRAPTVANVSVQTPQWGPLGVSLSVTDPNEGAVLDIESVRLTGDEGAVAIETESVTVDDGAWSYSFSAGNLDPGVYELEIVVADQFGATTTVDRTVVVNDEPKVTSWDVSGVKAGESATLEVGVVNEIGETTVTWRLPGNVTKTGTTITHTFDEPGTKRVVIVVSDDEGMSTKKAFDVSVERGGRPIHVAVAAVAGLGLVGVAVLTLRRRWT